VCRFNGKPVATESDIPFKEKLLGLMGIGVAPNGDVWIADGSDDQLLFFPGGQIKDGRIVKVAGLKSLRGRIAAKPATSGSQTIGTSSRLLLAPIRCPSDLDLGRRVRLHRNLWGGGPVRPPRIGNVQTY
jgi:hypothetical protein